MTSVTPEALIEAFTWRYATKAFDPDRCLDEAVFARLLEAALLAPSSFGLQPWHIVVVADPALRERLRAAAWDQSQVTEASHLLVLQAKSEIGEADVDALIVDTAAKRGLEPADLQAYGGMMKQYLAQHPAAADQEAWSTRQLYILLGRILDSAALLGIDACPMEGIDPEAFDGIVGTPGYASKVGVALGHRRTDDKYATAAKVRWPASCTVDRR